MSKIEVNTVEPQCGTTLTLGGSGDTVTLGSGASQSGFGRTGTVDWQTGSIKTATFTAANGEGYFANTTSGAFTMNLPSSPSAGNIVSVKDYAGTFDNNNLTVGRGGSNIEGQASDKVLSDESQAVTFVYVDATKGWLVINDMNTSQVPSFVAATGGNSTATCGDYKIHTFTGPGTFCVTSAGNVAGNNKIEYLVVAGGGGGGGPQGGGGGGAGGLRFASTSIAPLTYPAKPLAGTEITAAAQAYPIAVGGGGAKGSSGSGGGGCCSQEGTSGTNSSFSIITSAGGGGGGVGQAPRGPEAQGKNGGSGGGGGGRAGSGTGSSAPATGAPGGSGNNPPVTPAQGTDGGKSRTTGSPPNADRGGGGGGAIAAGSNAGGSTDPGGAGGAGGGFPTAFGSNGQPCGSFRYYAGGGGGGLDGPPGCAGAGGLGGGAAGIKDSTPGSNATDNTGGGGGGAGTSHPISGTNGGSGIVVIRYKFQ